MTAAVAGVARAAGTAAKSTAQGTAKGAQATAKGTTKGAARGAAKAAPAGAPAAGGVPSGRRLTPAEQAAGIQAIKDARPPEPATPELTATPAAPPPAAAAPSSTWRPPAEGVKAANTGGGFLLGLGAWVLVRTYLDGGSAGVKRLLKAKFFNEVTP